MRRDDLVAEAEAARDRSRSAARAEGIRVVGLAEAATEAARMDALRDLPSGVLSALAVRELAGQLPQIGQVTITPDVLTDLVNRLTPR